jgi:trehalose 6-phosphate synthase
LLDAFAADKKETSRRMRAMRRTVVQNDVAKWAADFLRELEELPEQHDKTVRQSRSR